LNAAFSDLKYVLPFWILACVAVYLSCDLPFFWDTIQLGSKHAHFYYESSFSSLLLPAEMDSGHPPLFGMYIAACWSLFGKSLAVAHFAMLPFLLLFTFSLFKIGQKLIDNRFGQILTALVLVDPVVSAQSILISPDIVVLAGFALGIWGVLANKNLLKMLAALLMALVSMRGMMVVVSVYLFDILKDFKWESVWVTIQFLIKKALPFVPSGILVLAFLIYHYQATGWIGYHEDSPWAVWFEKVDLKGFVKNIGVYGWRMLDFGRVFVWIALFAFFIKNRKQINFQSTKVKWLALLVIVTIATLSITPLLYKGLSAHRYLLPIFVAINSLVVYLIYQYSAWRKFWLALIFIGFATGNFWVYPPKVSQGWDSTLGHLPYFELKEQLYDYLQKEKIQLSQVGTEFPEAGALKYRYANDELNGFARADLATQEYIFYSNVMNDFADETLDELSNNWELVKAFERYPVCVKLYRKK